MIRAFLWAVAILVAGVPAGAQGSAVSSRAPSDAQPSRVALVTTFADGRTLTNLVTEKPGWFWTPLFPKVSTSAVPAVPPVRAVKLTFNRIALDINVVVSVLRGERLEQEEEVTRVTVPPGEHVSVVQLFAFGVQPIDLSQAMLPPTELYPPDVTTVSPLLAVAGIELMTAPFPGYRIELTNLAASPVAAFYVEGIRGSGKAAMTMVKTGADGRPVTAAQGGYVLEINLKGGASAEREILAPEPFERVVISAILWDDGTRAGAEPRGGDRLQRIPAEVGQRLQLARVRDVLTTALKEQGHDPDGLIARIRGDVEALPDAEPDRVLLAQMNMRETKTVILDDIRRFESEGVHDPTNDRRWVEQRIRDLEAWIKKLPPPA